LPENVDLWIRAWEAQAAEDGLARLSVLAGWLGLDRGAAGAPVPP